MQIRAPVINLEHGKSYSFSISLMSWHISRLIFTQQYFTDPVIIHGRYISNKNKTIILVQKPNIIIPLMRRSVKKNLRRECLFGHNHFFYNVVVVQQYQICRK